MQRVVILKADGLPGWLVERLLDERDPATKKPQLPWIHHVFVERGAWVRNFYSRGVSLSVPAWSILDTGRPMAITGNVEYDRYTLRVFDYLNFVPFYFKFAFSKTVDMPGVEVLDDLGVPLLADRFTREEVYQSFQLYQRGIRWDTLKRTARSPFRFTSPGDLLDEWQAGFELSRVLWQEIERDLIRALADPRVRYLDLFTGAYDHFAHLDNSDRTQRRLVSELDALVGRIWSAIEKSPLANRTLLVLVSDHGMTTSPQVYSQGYTLVDLLRSENGGGHHVITNRHPLTEYKLRGLYPFVHKVFTPSEASPYRGAGPKDYPTALLDLDGNERAGIYLRNSDLNAIHLLLLELQRRDLPPEIRRAAIQACNDAIERYADQSRSRLVHMRKELESLRASIANTESELRGAEKNRSTRRLKARVNSWETDARGYAEALAAITRLTSLNADGPAAAPGAVPKRLMGEPNTIHQLQNYVAGISPSGLQLAPDGTLDEARSFRRVDYFSLLTGLTVRNVVQEALGNRPVDFVAAPVATEALSAALGGSERPELGVWLHGGDEQQLLILARGDPVELKVLPVARLREDAAGNVEFDGQQWRAGLPLELFEDEGLDVADSDRVQWLSEWHSEREWLRATHRTRYSNGVVGLFEHFRGGAIGKITGKDFHWARRELVKADLLVLARNHWNFNVRGFNPGGNHGSFFRDSTHAVLMMAGGDATGVARGVRIEEPYDALSFVPTVLSLMGLCEPDLPGVPVQEVGAMSCAPPPPSNR